MKKFFYFLVFVVVVALFMSSCNEQKSKSPSAEVYRMMRIDSNSMFLCWNYDLDTTTLVNVFVSYSPKAKTRCFAFNGRVSGSGFVEQAINIKSWEQKSFFVEIYAENPERLLFSKELVEQISDGSKYVQEPWSYYVPKK